LQADAENKLKKFKFKRIAACSVILFIISFIVTFAVFSNIESVIDRIRKNGGTVQTRCILPDASLPYCPNWIEDMFQRPCAVWLPPVYGDDELAEILDIEGLSSLTASDTEITDKSLDRLAEYKGLELLYLSRRQFDINKIKWLEKQLPSTSVIY